MSLRIKKGDTVLVISGDPTRSKGLRGQVLAVFPKKGTAIVEGVNVRKKHMKARSQAQPGGIIDREMPIPLSKLMLAESGGKGRAARFSIKTDEKGAKVRVLKIKNEPKEITV
jgi:large subunit ribosomal protein L24